MKKEIEPIRDLEGVLRVFTNAKKIFNKKTGQLTMAGNRAYVKLTAVVYGLDEIGVIASDGDSTMDNLDEVVELETRKEVNKMW